MYSLVILKYKFIILINKGNIDQGYDVNNIVKYD